VIPTTFAIRSLSGELSRLIRRTVKQTFRTAISDSVPGFTVFGEILNPIDLTENFWISIYNRLIGHFSVFEGTNLSHAYFSDTDIVLFVSNFDE